MHLRAAVTTALALVLLSPAAAAAVVPDLQPPRAATAPAAEPVIDGHCWPPYGALWCTFWAWMRFVYWCMDEPFPCIDAVCGLFDLSCEPVTHPGEDLHDAAKEAVDQAEGQLPQPLDELADAYRGACSDIPHPEACTPAEPLEQPSPLAEQPTALSVMDLVGLYRSVCPPVPHPEACPLSDPHEVNPLLSQLLRDVTRILVDLLLSVIGAYQQVCGPGPILEGCGAIPARSDPHHAMPPPTRGCLPPGPTTLHPSPTGSAGAPMAAPPPVGGTSQAPGWPFSDDRTTTALCMQPVVVD